MKDKVFIIAEIGNTHEGSLGLAKQFIKSAAECGVDAVKFQTHIFEAESLASAPNPPYFKDESRKEYFERTAFTLKDIIKLKKYAEEEMGVTFFSSPFSLEAVKLLKKAKMDIFKIASGEVTNIPMLEEIGKTRKKVLLSSGMSSWNEIDNAVNVLTDNGCDDIILLQCTSEYPCPAKEAGLNVIDEMKDKYPSLTLGYSDHTLGVAVPLAAIVKGVRVVEKHFTLSNKMYGSDASNATEPDEFKKLVEEIRNLEEAMNYKVNKDEKVKHLKKMKMTFEKSIVTSINLKKGTVIEKSMLSFKKPGDGIPANEYERVIGKELNRDIEVNEKLNWDMMK